MDTIFVPAKLDDRKKEGEKEMTTTEDKMISILFFAWILQWFAAIWLPFDKLEFFFSGILCFALAALFDETQKRKEKNKK